MDELIFSKEEAQVLITFIEDSGMEYLYEYADSYGVDIDALVSKLKAAADTE